MLLAVIVLSGCVLRGRNTRSPRDGAQSDTGDHHRTAQVGGLRRTWEVHVPAPDSRPAGGMPVLIVLHGGGGSSAQMTFAGFDGIGDREGFMVVYPDGYRRHWNDGRTDGEAATVQEDVDDVAFLREVLAETSREFDVDAERVFVTGISNGAMMSARVACDMADAVAGVALVAGSMGEEQATRCAPSRPVAILDISGTADPLVPYGGGDVVVAGRTRGRVLGVDASIAMWVGHNRCDGEPIESELPDRDPHDASTVQAVSYGGCDASAPVRLLKVEGGGHTWPGHAFALPEALVGATNMDIDATETIWDFFADL